MDNILNFPNGDRETREVKRIKKQLYKGTKVKIEVCRLANGKEYKIAP